MHSFVGFTKSETLLVEVKFLDILMTTSRHCDRSLHRYSKPARSQDDNKLKFYLHLIGQE